MSAAKTNLGQIELSGNNSPFNFSPLYFFIFPAAVIAVLISTGYQLKPQIHPEAIRTILFHNLLFFLPLFYFVTHMNYAAYYLFESDMLRTILPLPYTTEKIHLTYRPSAHPLNGSFTAFICSLPPAVAGGCYTSSVLHGILIFCTLYLFLILLERLAVAVAVLSRSYFLKIRIFIPTAVAALFLFNSIFLLPDSPMPRGFHDVTAVYLKFHFPVLHVPTYILLLLSAIFFILIKPLTLLEKKIWNIRISRDILLNTAFPSASSGTGKRRKTSFDLTEKFAEKNRILKRYIYLFFDATGCLRVRHLFTALAVALILPPLLLLWKPALSIGGAAVLIPVVSIYVFFIVSFFKNNIKPLNSYVLPVGLTEYKIMLAFIIAVIYTISVALLLLIIYIFTPETRIHSYPLHLTILNFLETGLLVSAATFLFSPSNTFHKSNPLGLLFNALSAIFLFFVFIAGGCETFFLYARITEPTALFPVQHYDIIVSGFKLVITWLYLLIDQDLNSGNTALNIMTFIKTPTEIFIVPAYFTFISLISAHIYIDLKNIKKRPKQPPLTSMTLTMRANQKRRK